MSLGRAMRAALVIALASGAMACGDDRPRDLPPEPPEPPVRGAPGARLDLSPPERRPREATPPDPFEAPTMIPAPQLPPEPSAGTPAPSPTPDPEYL